MRRFLVVSLAALAYASPAVAAPSWAAPQIKTVLKAGLMGQPGQSFRPQQPLTRAALERALSGLEDRPAAELADPEAPVTIRELDAAVVGALRLGDAARALKGALVAGGLEPPRFAGTEGVARLLGLRFNHPAERDGLELLATDPATRAEAAFSLARALELTDYQLDWARSVSTSFALPQLNDWQQRILRRAVHFLGYPYVWGGTSESPEAPFGVQSGGGFDCSGFVWRVYKTEPFSGAPQLAETIRGRTTMEMARETKRPARIPFARLEPGDVLLFGDKGPKSKPRQIDHTGIYVGSGWFVHSSGQGVALATLDGGYREAFAFARRPLREAGLTQ